MRKFFALTMIALAFVVACKEEEQPQKENNNNGKENTNPGGQTTPEAYDNITVVLKGANLKTAWAAGDEIRVYCVTTAGADVEAKYVLKEGAGSATGKFAPAAGETALEKGGKDYFAAYPDDPDRTFAQHNTFTAVIPGEQTDPMPLFAHGTDAASLEMSSFMGAIKFVLEGEAELKAFQLEDNNSNCILFGNVTYNAKTGKATVKNSSASKHTVTYALPQKLILNGTSDPYVIEVPAGTLQEGGKITLFDMNDNAAAVLDFPGQTISAGVINDLGKLSFQAVSQTVDLSVAGTANCYIVPSTGEYKFKAVKGNSSEAVAATKVEVLWETRMDEDEVTAGTIIASVALNGSYVEFATAKPMVPGNALIAAKNADDVILWSWHIWVPETTVTSLPDPDAELWKTELLDRNLGALTVTDTTATALPKSYGMAYQWGRKDPFCTFSVAGTALSAAETETGAITTEFSIQNPTVLGKGSDSNWNVETITDLWNDGGGKTIYDPCPVGYKVPEYDTEYALWQCSSSGTYDANWVFNYEQHWFYNVATKAAFPATGYISGDSRSNEGKRTMIWSGDVAAEDNTARGAGVRVDLDRDNGKYYYKSYFKYAGGIVRCAKEH